MKIQKSRPNRGDVGKRARGWQRALSHHGVVLVALALAFPAWGYSDGIAGYAGAPGDPSQGQTRTCAGCHVGGQWAGDLELFVEESEEIQPLDLVAVDLSFTADGAAPARWGFNLIAIDDATGEPVGQLISIDDSTQLTTQGSGRGWQYLSHTRSGRNSELNGKPGWATDWQAPAEPVESVSFYVAFNAADGQVDATVFTQQVVVSVPEPGALGAGGIALMALAAVRTRRH